MSSRMFPLLLLPLAAIATGIGCSASHHQGSANQETASDSGGAAAASATDAAPDAPYNGPSINVGNPAGMMNCGNINSGYPGDDRCILPPPDGQGMQFHYGPSNYTDPNEVGKYLLMPGQEVTDCVFFATTNTTDVYFNEYHARMRPNSHHMLLYLQPIASTGAINSDGPQACNQGLQTRNLFGSQWPQVDLANLAGMAPEDDGLAVKVPAMQQAVMQLHFINAGSSPILREGWANIMYIDQSQVKELADPIFFIAGTGVNIQMGQTVTPTGNARVPMTAASDFRLVIGTGHYHTHTTHFTAWATIAGQKQVIIDEWNPLHHLPEPATWTFASTIKNPVPNEAEQAAGAYSGMLHMSPGDTITWQCTQTNDNVSSSSPAPYNAPAITFGNAVFTGEMCNMFGMYAPTTGSPWTAAGL